MVLQVHNEQELHVALEDAGDKLVVLDFFAMWCGPCKVMGPKVDEMAREFPNVVFIKIDVDECESIAEQYQVSAMPTFVFVRRSERIDIVVGAKKEAIVDSILKFS